MSTFKPISFDDLDLSKEDMETIAAGARVFLAPEEADEANETDIEEAPELEEAPSDLVTRRNLRE